MPVPDVEAHDRPAFGVFQPRVVDPAVLLVAVAEIHAPPLRDRSAAEIVTGECRRGAVVAEREIPPCAAYARVRVLGHAHVAARYGDRFGDVVVARPDRDGQLLVLVDVEQFVGVVHRVGR